MRLGAKLPAKFRSRVSLWSGGGTSEIQAFGLQLKREVNIALLFVVPDDNET